MGCDVLMTFWEYQRRSKRTTPSMERQMYLNAALGIAGEAGEVADIIKKHFFQGHELDKNKIVEELGDVMFYIAFMCNLLGVEMEDVAIENVKKLLKRYPDGFDPDRSVNRD